MATVGAERGYEYAQRALGWPITADDMPYLTCAPYPPPTSPGSGDGKPAQADSIKGFRFLVSLHNARPLLERPVISAENLSEEPEHPNIQVSVYRIENGRRVDVPHRLSDWGGGTINARGAITDQSKVVGVRIPVEEAERRLYIEQFLALLSRVPGQTPEKVQQTRQMMLHSDRQNASYLDEMMPNRLGTFEVICRYQSQKPGFWPEPLEAAPMRFEYVKTTNWIEVFNRKKDTPR